MKLQEDYHQGRNRDRNHRRVSTQGDPKPKTDLQYITVSGVAGEQPRVIDFGNQGCTGCLDSLFAFLLKIDGRYRQANLPSYLFTALHHLTRFIIILKNGEASTERDRLLETILLDFERKTLINDKHPVFLIMHQAYFSRATHPKFLELLEFVTKYLLEKYMDHQCAAAAARNPRLDEDEIKNMTFVALSNPLDIEARVDETSSRRSSASRVGDTHKDVFDFYRERLVPLSGNDLLREDQLERIRLNTISLRKQAPLLVGVPRFVRNYYIRILDEAQSLEELPAPANFLDALRSELSASRIEALRNEFRRWDSGAVGDLLVLSHKAREFRGNTHITTTKQTVFHGRWRNMAPVPPEQAWLREIDFWGMPHERKCMPVKPLFFIPSGLSENHSLLEIYRRIINELIALQDSLFNAVAVTNPIHPEQSWQGSYAGLLRMMEQVSRLVIIGHDDPYGWGNTNPQRDTGLPLGQREMLRNNIDADFEKVLQARRVPLHLQSLAYLWRHLLRGTRCSIQIMAERSRVDIDTGKWRHQINDWGGAKPTWEGLVFNLRKRLLLEFEEIILRIEALERDLLKELSQLLPNGCSDLIAMSPGIAARVAVYAALGSGYTGNGEDDDRFRDPVY